MPQSDYRLTAPASLNFFTSRSSSSLRRKVKPIIAANRSRISASPRAAGAGGRSRRSIVQTPSVCAAVSVLLQAAWLGLKEHAGVATTASRRSGKLELRWPSETRDREDVRAIVATTALSLESLAAQYPEHIRVVRERESKEKPLSAREGDTS